MEESTVGGRDGAAKTGLLGTLSLAPQEMLRLLKQVFGQCHALFPCRFSQFGLLRCAPIIEIRFQSEAFHRSDNVENSLLDALRGFILPIFPARFVRKEHSKKNRRASGGVRSQCVTKAHDLWPQRLCNFSDGGFHYSLIDDPTGHDRHRRSLSSTIPRQGD